MELLDRYLQAVRFWLPKREQDDIIAELSANIREQMDDRAAELGRALTTDEQAAILKQHGRPMLVASQYGRGPHQLIGPALYPVYRRVLKLGVVAAAAIYVVVAAIVTFTGGGSLFNQLLHLPSILLIVAACQTLVFVAIDRAVARQHFIDRWDPLTLPKLVQAATAARGSRVSRMHYLSELVCDSVFGTWWLAALRSPHLVFGPGAAVITFAPIWQRLFIAFLAFIALETATAAVNLVRPDWLQFRSASRLVTRVLGLLIALALLRSGSLIVPAAAALSENVAGIISQITVISVIVGAMILAFQLAVELRAMMRRSRQVEAAPRSA